MQSPEFKSRLAQFGGGVQKGGGNFGGGNFGGAPGGFIQQQRNAVERQAREVAESGSTRYKGAAGSATSVLLPPSSSASRVALDDEARDRERAAIAAAQGGPNPYANREVFVPPEMTAGARRSGGGALLFGGAAPPPHGTTSYDPPPVASMLPRPGHMGGLSPPPPSAALSPRALFAAAHHDLPLGGGVPLPVMQRASPTRAPGPSVRMPNPLAQPSGGFNPGRPGGPLPGMPVPNPLPHPGHMADVALRPVIGGPPSVNEIMDAERHLHHVNAGMGPPVPGMGARKSQSDLARLSRALGLGPTGRPMGASRVLQSRGPPPPMPMPMPMPMPRSSTAPNSILHRPAPAPPPPGMFNPVVAAAPAMHAEAVGAVINTGAAVDGVRLTSAGVRRTLHAADRRPMGPPAPAPPFAHHPPPPPQLPTPEQVRRSIAAAVRRSQADALRTSLHAGAREEAVREAVRRSTAQVAQAARADEMREAAQRAAVRMTLTAGVRRTLMAGAAQPRAHFPGQGDTYAEPRPVLAPAPVGVRKTLTLVPMVPTDGMGMPLPPMPVPPVTAGDAQRAESRRAQAAARGKPVKLPASCFDCMHFGGCRNGWASDLELAPPLPGFTVRRFVWGTHECLVYTTGVGPGRPGVVLMHQLPGFTPRNIALARKLADGGLCVVVPVLFGVVGEPYTGLYMYRERLRVCYRKELGAWKLNKTPPIVELLRALAVEVHRECGGRGVAAIGADITAPMALAMAVQPSVVAAVMLHPWKPYTVSKKAKADVGVSPQCKMELAERLASGLDVMAVRFLGDKLVTPAKFAELTRLLGRHFFPVEVPGNGHWVLTEHLVDTPGHATRDAFNQVLGFLRDRLLHGASQLALPMTTVVVDADEPEIIVDAPAPYMASKLVLIDWHPDIHGC